MAHVGIRKLAVSALLAGWIVAPSAFLGAVAPASAHSSPTTVSTARASQGQTRAIPDTIDNPAINYYQCSPCVCWRNIDTGATGTVYCCPNSQGTPCDYTHVLTYGIAHATSIYAGGLTSLSIQKLNLHLQAVATYTGIPGEPVSDFAVGKKSLVAASFGCVGSSCGDNVLTYWGGFSPTPTQTIVDGNLSSMSSLAMDNHDDVFVAGQSAATGALEVDEVSAKSGAIKALGVTGSVAAGLAIDNHNDLWVEDQGNGVTGTMSEYTPATGYSNPATSFAVSAGDTKIAVDAQGGEMLASNNILDGSEYASQMIAYQLPAGNIIATSQTTYGGESLGVSFVPRNAKK
jgi:hypothetical protein